MRCERAGEHVINIRIARDLWHAGRLDDDGDVEVASQQLIERQSAALDALGEAIVAQSDCFLEARFVRPYVAVAPCIPLSDAAWELDQGNYGAAIFLGALDVGTGGRGKIATSLIGKAQETFRAGRIATGHAFASARAALAMVRSGDYSKVALNRTLSKITDGDVASKLRPDVAGVRADGKVDITEVLSPGQDAAELQVKLFCSVG